MDEKDRSIRILPTETYFTMVRRMLSESGSAYVRITGTSMLPLLRHLRDGVIIEPLYRQEAGKDIPTYPNPSAPVGTSSIHTQSIHSDGACKSSDSTLSDGTSLSDISASTLQSKPDGNPLNDISVSTQQFSIILLL